MNVPEVVIGSGFGDEGKGLITDYYSSKLESGKVVRFNGGAQAGHTVVSPDEKRHIFGHFGSGTLCNLSTYLSEYFVVNPILFFKEKEKLDKIGINSQHVICNPECMVTTPFDMIINQIIEEHRSIKKHGSCGVGFNETIERNLNSSYSITVKDLKNFKWIELTLKHIQNVYVSERLKKLGVLIIPDKYIDLLQSKKLISKFIDDLDKFSKLIQIEDYSVLKNEDLIFEGAQGLLLDETHPYFPHVTRSRTGLHNVVNILKKIGIDKMNVTYVTRIYSTRHGCGPFPEECIDKKPYENIIDETNTINNYQGKLRLGLLNLDTLSSSIHRDLTYAIGNVKIDSLKLAITCIDQIDKNQIVQFIDGRILNKKHIYDFLSYIKSRTGVDSILISNGNTRDNVNYKIVQTCNNFILVPENKILS